MRRILLLICSSVLLFSSCMNEFNQIYKTDDYHYKYEYAKQCFAEGKYQRAITLLESVVTQEKGTDNAQESLYMLSMAEYCYKDYQKAKNAEKILTEQIAKGEQELAYLASVLDALTRAESARDLQEIRAELVSGGYLRETDRKKRMKLPPSRPMRFTSSDGFPILVGRSNRQNDELTTKLAAKTDIWLHVQKIPGSHVIIETDGRTPPDRTVTEAMQLAAYYSQARGGQNVPVDYTPVKFVKKPAGAKPGMVIYTTYQTAVATPDAALCERLKEKD